ncbi:uncharacterized protein L969DRAFT_90232, partial [Mixia osmundae IAM 14324]|uniref:uncharacterized protein n=1 Tax=Mixia osmundae (strain CBS 9802 / IAM 14324 / JCM 22182 / KY 12970) TaxID=764103 RepID=UPI0004A55960
MHQVEMGSKNHEVVPSTLIAQIAGVRHGGVNKCLGELAKRNLVARVQGAKYDGYRLTYGGYDFLAMRSFAKRDTVYSVGNQIGVGKESDIYVVADEEGEQRVLKIHRLGRISFRSIKTKRDYMQNRKSASWMYMSRLAAVKEYAFMKVLYENGFPVPTPIDQARHCIIMGLIDAFPLRQVSEIANPGSLYSALMDLIVRLARAGLIHGDFNEFNILIREREDDQEPEPILIDFPQMVSTQHENAEYYFNRDVSCIRAYFKKRYRYESTVWPKFSTVVKNGQRDFNLDVEVEASGWTKQDDKQLSEYRQQLDTEPRDSDEDEEDESAGEEDSEEEGSDEDEIGNHSAPNDVDAPDEPDMAKLELAEDAASSGISDDDDDDDAASSVQSDNGERRRSSNHQRPKRAVPDVAKVVASSMTKEDKSQTRKHHSKTATKRTLGRKKGSKAKVDTRRTVRDAATF